jgi:anaerobic selenocysteine-containing dehydrogenase
MSDQMDLTAGERTAYRTCPLCEATCGLEITIKDGRAVHVRGDRDDVFSRGYLCPKGTALADLHHDPDRLRRPLVKKEGVFREVSWDEAFAAVQAGLMPLIEKHGKNAVGLYLGNPNAHTMAGALAVRPFIKALGSRNVFSASTVDQIPKHLASGLMFGHPATIAVPDLDRTDYLLILGADPMESNGSLATAPDWPGRLRALKERGGRLVVVDPRRTRTAGLAHWHLAIRPNADAFLLMALVQVLFAEDLARPGRLADHALGIDQMKELSRPFTPEAVEGHTGIPADQIRTLARELAGAPSAAVYGRMGLSTVGYGGLATWLVDVVNVLTGNLDRPGGAMFPTPAHLPKKQKPGGKGWTFGRWASRVGGFPEILGELPAHTLCDEMETPGEGQIRALITIASNPVIGLPNAARVDRALAALDFMVSVDFYVNASTRHAHVILPPTGPLSTAHYDVNFYNMSVRNIAHYSPPVLPMPDDERDKWEIFYKLALIFSGQGSGADVGTLDDFVTAVLVGPATQKPGSPLFGKEAEILAELKLWKGPDRMLDFMLRTGPHGDGFGVNPDGLTLAKLREQPHGIDLGPLEPRIPGILATPSGKIELAPEPMVQDAGRLKKQLGEKVADEPLLIGRRHLRTNNSWMPNIPVLVKGPDRSVLFVHPDDAIRWGLTEDGRAKVVSRVGEVTVPVRITDEIRPGVVSLPHGWGHDLDGVQMATAREHGGVNVNLVTDDERFDPLSQNSALNGVPVRVFPAA